MVPVPVFQVAGQLGVAAFLAALLVYFVLKIKSIPSWLTAVLVAFVVVVLGFGMLYALWRYAPTQAQLQAAEARAADQEARNKQMQTEVEGLKQAKIDAEKTRDNATKALENQKPEIAKIQAECETRIKAVQAERDNYKNQVARYRDAAFTVEIFQDAGLNGRKGTAIRSQRMLNGELILRDTGAVKSDRPGDNWNFSGDDGPHAIRILRDPQ